MKFRERLCEAIKSSDMTQKEIAEKLHIRETNITNWKKGDNLPSLEMFYKLCVLLDETPNFLLGFKDD